MPVLDPTFNEVVRRMAPNKVLYVSTQYADFEAMRKDFENTGYLRINTEFSDNTIFGDASVNWKFRAWHDMCHILANADFSPEGEASAGYLMQKQIWTMEGPSFTDKMRWVAIIEAEVNGQGDYYRETGTFPADQLAFDREFLTRNFPEVVFPVITGRNQKEMVALVNSFIPPQDSGVYGVRGH